MVRSGEERRSEERRGEVRREEERRGVEVQWSLTQYLVHRNDSFHLKARLLQLFRLLCRGRYITQILWIWVQER